MSRGSIGAALAAMCLIAAGLAQTATAQQRGGSGMQSDGGALPNSAAAPLPPLTEGLPPTEKNVELVGKVELSRTHGNVDPGQIADVSHKGNYAYLNSWQSETRARCDRGGVFVVDIKDPAAPREVGFIASPKGSYPGEGSQVVSLDTPAFKGDLLTINNEACVDPDSTPDTLNGGITLIDVTNPLASGGPGAGIRRHDAVGGGAGRQEQPGPPRPQRIHAGSRDRMPTPSWSTTRTSRTSTSSTSRTRARRC